MTTKKDWTGNKQSAFTPLGASNHSEHERPEHDYYATEPKAIDKLFEVLGNSFSPSIWECACGEGHMSKRLLELNPNLLIRNSDIIVRNFPCEALDFLDYYNPNSFDGDIITNPPYKYAQEFVENSLLTITDNHLVCMFLKITFLEGQKRRQLFESFPPHTVYVSSERLMCAMNGDFLNTKSSAVAYGWFIWKKGYKENTIIKWI